MEEEFLVAADEGQFFELPLVDDDGVGGDMVEEGLWGGEAFEHFAELGSAGAFGAGGDDEDAAAGFDDVAGGGDAFDGLVESEVEGVAGGGSDDSVDGFFDAF